MSLSLEHIEPHVAPSDGVCDGRSAVAYDLVKPPVRLGHLQYSLRHAADLAKMMPFIGLALPSHAVSALNRNGITSIDELLRLNIRELGDLGGVGPKTVDLIVAALTAGGLTLEADPWASYVCVRHGKQAADAALATFLLCPDCREQYTDNAFSGEQPEWVGTEAIEGYCGHCNEARTDISVVQWHLCSMCKRIVRSLGGRSRAAAKYVLQVWEERISPYVPHIVLTETDPPELRPRGKRSDPGRKVFADFTGFSANQPQTALFGFELKTGRKAVFTNDGIGKPMSRFQLDTTDCDDITTVIARENIPVYLIHVQVLGRAYPPTERFHGVGLWWTDQWAMNSHFMSVQVRPRETRNAAYYDIRMFRDVASLTDHLSREGYLLDQDRLLRDGQPALY